MGAPKATRTGTQDGAAVGDGDAPSHVVRLDGAPLIRVGARPALRDYLRQVWDFRHFIIYDSHSRVQSANTNDSLGRFWMVMNPILNGFAYFLVFGLLLLSFIPISGIPNILGLLISQPAQQILQLLLGNL